jgi:hypothetical protein
LCRGWQIDERRAEMSDGLAVVQEGPEKGPKKGPKTELQRLQDALEAVDKAIETLKNAIREAGKVDVPGVDVRYNLGTKLGALLAETGLKIPRGAKA